MTEHKTTSAGRLAEEAQKIRSALRQGNSLFYHIPILFGSEDVHWSRGLSAYVKLVNNVSDDLKYLTEGRKHKFEETLGNLKVSFDSDKFHIPSEQIRNQYYHDIAMEMIESIDDLLKQAGRSISISRERAGIVSEEINQILLDIKSGPESEIDDFLESRLKDLSFILDKYQLFGPNGVKDAVATMLGSIVIENVARGGLSENAQKNAKAVWRVAKGALDILVYANSGADAIAWAGGGIAGFLEG